MKLLKLALLAGLFLTGCIANQTLERQVEKPRPQILQLDHSAYKKLTGSTALYTVMSKVSVAVDGGIIQLIQKEWTGSAFCIGIETDSKGVRRSIWLTCQHVADARMIPNSFAEIDYKDADGRLVWARVDEILISNRSDVAMFSSLAIPQSTLELASPKEVDNFNLGDFLLIAGHPAGSFPTAVSLGIFAGYGAPEADIRFTTFATYGTSGSPLIDGSTLKVVGIVYKFAGSKHRWGFRADDLYAVSANIIRRDFAIR